MSAASVTRDDLRARAASVSLRALVARSVKLRKVGGAHVGLCPFHAEKTASFNIFHDNKFRCFGCGKHGDVIDFVQLTEGVGFHNAIAILNSAELPKRHAARQVNRHVNRKDNEADRIAYARRLWREAGEITGPGALHLVDVRRFTKPEAGWPPSLRYHHGKHALIVAATDEAGDVCMVQAIKLATDGTSIKKELRSYGSQGGQPCRYTGNPALPLIVAEGPMTGMAAWLALPGHETWCALGSVTKLSLPRGDRTVLVLVDDDVPDKTAEVETWAAEQRAAGSRVVLVWPFDQRRHNGHDFADLAHASGLGAVRQRIVAACPQREISLEDARAVMAAGIEQWLADAGPRHLLVPFATGSGKTHVTLDATVRDVARRKAAGEPHRLLWAMPDHELGRETEKRIATQAAAAGLTVARLLGYGDPAKPLTDASPCRNLDAVMLALGVGASPLKAVCGPAPGGNRCAHHAGCPKLASHAAAETADIVLLPHAYAFEGGHLPASIRAGVQRVVIDENILGSAVTIARLGLEAFASPLLDRAPVLHEGEPDPVATGELRQLQAMLVAAADAPDAAGYVTTAGLRAAGLTPGSPRQARALTYDRKVSVAMRPGMPLDDRRIVAAAARINGQLGHLAAVWHAAEAVMTGTDTSAGRLRVDVETTDHGQARVLVSTGLKPLAPWLLALPVLLLDASGDLGNLRRVLPDAEVASVPAIATPHARNHLIVGGFGGAALRSEQKQRDLIAFMVGKMGLPDTGLLVTHKSTVPAFSSTGLDLAVRHHGAVAGRDEHRKVRCQFIVGARSLPPQAAAELAAALTGEAVPITGRVRLASSVRLRDGSTVASERMGYADPRTLAAHDGVYHADITQAAGRGRAVLRTAATPLDTYICSNAPPPGMVFDSVQRWADVRPDCIDAMLQAGAVTESPTHAHALHPGIFPGTAKAAELRIARAVARDRRRFNLPPSMDTAQVISWRVARQAEAWGQAWTSDTYQRVGQGHAPAVIHAPVTAMALTRRIVAQALGPVTWRAKEVVLGLSKHSLQEARTTSPGHSGDPVSTHPPAVWTLPPPGLQAARVPDGRPPP